MDNMANAANMDKKIVEFYKPFDDLSPDCARLINKAKKTIASMDKVDGGVNIADMLHLGAWLRTVMTALLSGLEEKNFNLIADSYVMLSQIEKQVRELEKSGFQIVNPILY